MALSQSPFGSLSPVSAPLGASFLGTSSAGFAARGLFAADGASFALVFRSQGLSDAPPPLVSPFDNPPLVSQFGEGPIASSPIVFPQRLVFDLFDVATGAPDLIVGGPLDDNLRGFAGDDTLFGAGGDDLLSGDAGNDLIIGGSGFDTALFDVALTEVLASRSGDIVVLRSTLTGETDLLVSVEQVQFRDSVHLTSLLPPLDSLSLIASHPDLATVLAATSESGIRGVVQVIAQDDRVTAFDPLQYVASHDDLIVAIGADPDAAMAHWLVFGAAEGREPDTFDAAQYLANYEDLRATFGTDESAATLHFIQFGFAEGRTDEVLLT